MSIAELTNLFGWMTVINIAILLFTTLIVVIFKNRISSMHSKIFSIDKNQVLLGYFDYLSRYKALILFFNLAPYVALRFFH
jgi:hypothetical protein